jgi:hypothetical protein
MWREKKSAFSRTEQAARGAGSLRPCSGHVEILPHTRLPAYKPNTQQQQIPSAACPQGMPLNLDIAKLSKRFLFLKRAAVQILQLCSIVPRSFRSRVAFVVPARRSAHWWLATEL